MTYAPGNLTITAITQANPAVVTTSTNHNLQTGNIVRLHVPKVYGMFQLDNLAFIITVISTNTFSLQTSQAPFTVNVNTINFPAFSVPATQTQIAQAIPIGAGPTPELTTPVAITNNICDSTLGDTVLNIATTNQPF